MKKLIYTPIICVFIYAIFSFVSLEVDFRNWSMEARYLFCMFPILYILMIGAYGLVSFVNSENK